MRALSERLYVGTRAEMAGARTRSHLADGRCVGWFGDADVIIDAELVDRPVPRVLAARYGHERFWERWTAMECAAKAADVPVGRWLRRHGLAGAEDQVVRWFRGEGVVVAVGLSQPR